MGRALLGSAPCVEDGQAIPRAIRAPHPVRMAADGRADGHVPAQQLQWTAAPCGSSRRVELPARGACAVSGWTAELAIALASQCAAGACQRTSADHSSTSTSTQSRHQRPVGRGTTSHYPRTGRAGSRAWRREARRAGSRGEYAQRVRHRAQADGRRWSTAVEARSGPAAAAPSYGRLHERAAAGRARRRHCVARFWQ